MRRLLAIVSVGEAAAMAAAQAELMAVKLTQEQLLYSLDLIKLEATAVGTSLALPGLAPHDTSAAAAGQEESTRAEPHNLCGRALANWLLQHMKEVRVRSQHIVADQRGLAAALLHEQQRAQSSEVERTALAQQIELLQDEKQQLVAKAGGPVDQQAGGSRRGRPAHASHLTPSGGS
ncbi:hypothetical protein HaLaN_29164 [Haematococcus lacustris]|uniref:Uncharacterized protein n=1 Tax=Haematococcus lacustris TaxID=44745 RepID=A0A6A0ABW1_HAELA|nr:hypothetical protein HaLaN_29164 [Haematococcus lacustris]